MAQTDAGAEPPLYKNAAFLRLFCGSLAGKLGERLYQMAAIAAILTAFGDTRQAIALITLAGVLPQFVLLPFAANLIDRCDRRRLLWGACALSALVVWAFVPLYLDDPRSDAFQARWQAYILPLMVALSILVLPIGPARASAIPDVVPPRDTDLAACLAATSGLAAILVGTFAGGLLASAFGSLAVIPVAAGCYVLGAVLFRWLPDGVAVPGFRRGKAQDEHRGEERVLPLERLRAYARESWAGLRYALRRAGVVELIFFETAFWFCAVVFYLLFDWHAAQFLNLSSADRIVYFSAGLGCAGIGLFGGALLIGRTCRHISPIWTFPLAFVLVGVGLFAIFRTHGAETPEAYLERYLAQAVPRQIARHSSPDSAQDFRTKTEERLGSLEGLRESAQAALPHLGPADRAALERLLPQTEPTPENLARQEQLRAAQSANRGLAFGLFPFLFVLGLGGGILLGRVDADMLAIVEPSMRGRVFAVKGFAFTGALMAALALLSFDRRFDTALAVAHALPVVLLLLAVPVFVMAWMLDVGIYHEPKKLAIGGPVEIQVFYILRFVSWLIMKAYFRLSIAGAEKIPPQGPVILIANHGSFLDPIWLGDSVTRRVQYIMHSSYYYTWALPFFRHTLSIPVDTESQTRALKAGSAALEKGICVGMFPEGTVTRTGQMNKPKLGAIFLAQRAGATVVPCAIDGNRRAFGRQMIVPRPRRVTIRVGTPFTVPKDAKREEIAELLDQGMAEIAAMLSLDAPPACAEDFRNRRGKNGEGERAEAPASQPAEEGKANG